MLSFPRQPRLIRRGGKAGIQPLDPPVKPEDDKQGLYGQTLIRVCA